MLACPTDEFGDFTRAGIKGFEGAVREATGNEECMPEERANPAP